MSRCRALALALLLVSAVFAGGRSAAVAASAGPRLLYQGPCGQGMSADDQLVVWAAGEDNACRANIYAMNLTDGSTFAITSTPAFRADPAVDGDLVVWSDSGPQVGATTHIVGWKRATGQQFDISAPPEDGFADVGPQVSGDWVVWQHVTTGGAAIVARNVATMAPPITLDTSQLYVRGPRIDAGRVVWMPGDGNSWSLYLSPVDHAEPQLLDHGPGYTFGLDIAGGIVSYSAASQLWVYHLASGYPEAIGPDGSGAATDGRYVFSYSYSYAADSPPNVMGQLTGYDLQTGAVFGIELEFGNGYRVAVSGGQLVWEHVPKPSGETRQLLTAPIADLLPSAPRAAPSAPDPNVQWFAETGHALGYGFKGFWDAQGGLPVFGYPLTEEYQERSQDIPALFTVQYVERQRFEWHPELAGTPYEVELGRLGAELLQRQGRDWTTFPQADAAAAHYMPTTGHAIAPEFWDYWSSHGLDLGDLGVSFRESLALFGYPLSEPMTETNADGDTVLTQYFERAVFEWHPDNPEPYRVLLRRLGAEALVARGW